jgi:hypothetical protein
MSVYPNFVKLWNFGAYGWHNPVALQNMTVGGEGMGGGHSTVWLFHNEPNISRRSTLELLSAVS